MLYKRTKKTSLIHETGEGSTPNGPRELYQREKKEKGNREREALGGRKMK